MGLTRNYATAIHDWLSEFAPVLREPITEGLFDAEHPKPNEYISYSAVVGNFSQSFMQSITIYSKSTSNNNLMNIVDAIENEIGEDGVKIQKDWGYLTIYKGNPFYQDKPDEDSAYRAGYINLEVTVYQFNV